MKNSRSALILFLIFLFSFAPLTTSAEEIPEKLLDLHQISNTKWAVGDFGHHIKSQGKNTYGPENVVDGLPETAWVTKDDPSYIFKDMMIGFVSLDNATISEFTIRNGYCKSRDTWEKNSRAKKMKVFIDKKPVITVTLKDSMEEQTFSLGEDYNFKADDVISFLILETYPGTKYDDIAISELSLDYDTVGLSDEGGVAGTYTITKKFNTRDSITNKPAVANGVIYIAGGSGILYAVDISTSKQLWQFDSKSSILTPPCVVEGAVYFGNLDGNLFALKANTGQELWRFGMEGEERISFSPSVIGDVVYFAGGDPWKYGVVQKDKLYALDKNSGRELWRFKTEGMIDYYPCVVDSVVYFVSGKDFYAVDKNTGQKLWGFKTENWVGSPRLVDGVVYFGNYDGNFYAVDTKTGQKLWRFKTEGRIRTSPCVVNGVVYFGSDIEGIFYAVNIRTGLELWQYKTKGSRCYSPIIVDNVVYFVSGGTEGPHDDNFYALDKNTGKQLWWRYAAGRLPVFINGVIYLAGEFGISAMDRNTGEVIWSFNTEFKMCTDPVVFNGVVYFGCEDGYLYSVK